MQQLFDRGAQHRIAEASSVQKAGPIFRRKVHCLLEQGFFRMRIHIFVTRSGTEIRHSKIGFAASAQVRPGQRFNPAPLFEEKRLRLWPAALRLSLAR